MVFAILADMRNSNKIRSLLSLLLSLQMGLAPALSYGSTPPVDPLAKFEGPDPIWQQFLNSPADSLEFKYSADDPAIDRDPYFLRSQSWEKTAAVNETFGFQKDHSGVEITVPGTSSLLRLNLPLTPVQATQEFLFFSLDQTSDLFQKAAGSEKPGEGLFFISRDELFRHAVDAAQAANEANRQQVPVFFFPLPGQGWKGKIKSLELAQIDTLSISNSAGTSIGLELKDVETLMKAQQLNLLMAISLTARNRNVGPNEAILPASGTTAAFGLFFTGIDLDNPGKSLWSHSIASRLEWLKSYLVPEARAQVLSPDVIGRVVFVGTVLTGMLALSVVLKYASPGIRRKVNELHPSNPGDGLIKKMGREAVGIFDVFAHVTTTAAQLPAVTVGNAIEMFLDRFAPSVSASEHTLVRRFLNSSFYFARNSVRGAPVNAKTFLLGALVMGSIDTAFVVVQYLVAVPWLCQAVSPYLSPYWQNKINMTFDPNNPNTRSLAIQSSVQTGIAYLMSGASSMSIESRAQVVTLIEREVDKEMVSQGKDPKAPQYQSERKAMIDDRIDQSMKQKGLPAKDGLIFDATTPFSKLAEALGNKTPEDLQGKESFILATRFSLTKTALARALETARADAKRDSSQLAQDTVSILEETSQKIGFIKNGIQSGMSGLREARQVRQQLTLLSYEGPVEWAVRYLPDSWSKEYSPQAAQAAGLIFRQSIYSYLSKEGASLIKPLKSSVTDFGAEAKAKALEDMRQAHPELAGLSPEDFKAKVKSTLGFELRLRTQLQINQLARAKADKVEEQTYTPPKIDWLEAHQRKNSEVIANQKLASLLSDKAPRSSSEVDRLWQSFYTQEMARQVGLYLPDGAPKSSKPEDVAKMLDFVDKTATSATDSQIKNIKGLSGYLDKQSPAEQLKVRSAMYASNYLEAYKTATTDMELISPTDPYQPGRFQKIRQTSIVRESSFLTHTLRVTESFMNDQAIKPGLLAFFGRNIPLFDDMVQSHQRLAKMFLPLASVSYLWSYFVWQVQIPFGSYILGVATIASTIWVPSQWLNRAFRMSGVKSSDGILGRVAYAVPYSWVTFFGMIPLTLFAPEANLLVADYLLDPLLGVLTQIPMSAWIAAAAAIGVVGVAVKANAFEKMKKEIKTFRKFEDRLFSKEKTDREKKGATIRALPRAEPKMKLRRAVGR